MRLAVLLLALAAPAAAQTVETRAEAPPTSHRLVLVGAALGGTAAGLVAGPLAPLATAPVIYWTGRSLGYDAPFGRVVVDWMIGAAVGLVTYHGLLGGIYLANGGEADLSDALGSAVVGLGVSTVVTALLYEADVPAEAPVDAAPVALRLPDGQTVPGLRLAIGL